MILRNFYNMMALFVMGLMSNGASNTNYGEGHLNYKKINGSIAAFSSNSIDANTTLGYSSTTLVLGKGTTPPTFDDYKLEDEIVVSSSTFTTQVQNGSIVYDAETRTHTKDFLITISNKSGEELVFTEYGLVLAPGNSSANKFLAYREVLETPIRIPVGESVFFRRKISFTMPTI